MTAEEYLNKHHFHIVLDIKDTGLYQGDITTAMIEFAKLHVEAQAQEIVEKVKMKDLNENNELNMNEDDSNFEYYVVDKNSILEAYPLTNIK